MHWGGGVGMVGNVGNGWEMVGNEVGNEVGTDVGKEVGKDVGNDVGRHGNENCGEAAPY
jgi:hypothetical protein